MQKRFLAGLGCFALVSLALTGCSQQQIPDGFIDKSGQIKVDPNKLPQKALAIGDFSEDRVAVKFDNGYAGVDKNGGVAFVKDYRFVGPYAEGLAPFSVGKSSEEAMWGFINPAGEKVIEPTYGAVGNFAEGVAPVRMHKDDKGAKAPGKWCYIDKTGKPTIDKVFDEAGPFADGLAVVKENGKMGCIDKTGKYIVPAQYDVVYPEDVGVIVAAQGDGLSEDNRDQMLEYFDRAGNSISRKSIAPVSLKNLHQLMWLRNEFKLKDEKAEEQRKFGRPLCSQVSPGFQEGVAVTQEGKRFTHMNNKLKLSPLCSMYDYVFPFSEGMAAVYDDNNGGKIGFIDSQFQLMIPYKFWDAAPFSNGLALVQETKDGPYGFIDKTGRYVLQPIYQSARSFKDDRALVGKSALLVPKP